MDGADRFSVREKKVHDRAVWCFVFARVKRMKFEK